jgi:hypothetical protein
VSSKRRRRNGPTAHNKHARCCCSDPLSRILLRAGAERQVARMREAYLRALLRQPPAWHDVRKDGAEVSSRLAEDMLLVQAGIGEKMTLGALVELRTALRLPAAPARCNRNPQLRPLQTPKPQLNRNQQACTTP